MNRKPAVKRRRFGWRRIHKWMGVSGGVLLLLWIVTGIFLTIPGRQRARLESDSPLLDFRAVSISPAQAIDGIEAAGFDVGEVRSVRLEPIGSQLAYKIALTDGGLFLVDATTGLRLEISAEVAALIATALYTGPGDPSEPVLVESWDLGYFQGAVPAYRVTFSDRHNTRIYVDVQSGAVAWWDGKSWLGRFMDAMHALRPVGVVFGAWPARSLMLGGSLLALFLALSGYYLAWRRGGWRLRARSSGSASGGTT